jgi:hypothetical protein
MHRDIIFLYPATPSGGSGESFKAAASRLKDSERGGAAKKMVAVKTGKRSKTRILRISYQRWKQNL